MSSFTAFATMSLTDLISKPLALIQGKLKSTEVSANSLSGRLGKLATGFGKAAIAAGVFLGALGLTTGSAMAFESKMADVAKVVTFESPAELNEMQRTLEDLSMQIPIAAEGFADITAAAAQSGVAKDDLVDFSVQAAKMGVAFDVAAGDASKTMADWRAGMGLTLQETYSLADAVNHLANNMNATAPDISEVLNRMGAVGKAAGFTETELAALAATGLSTGATAEIVGTGFNSIFSTLTQGQAMTDRAAQAFQSLGYDAESLAKSMQMDAKGTMLSVLESIAALPKDVQLSAITSAFGQESLKMIAPMVGNLDNVRQAWGLVGEAANYAGSMEGEYAARSATTENSLQLMKNSFNVLAITVGKIFLPVLNSIAKAISFVTGLLIEFGRSETGAFIIKLAAGIAGAVLAVGGLITALAIIKPIIIMVGAALSGVLWPITLIAGGVALLSIAWKKDFMGIATAVTNFASKMKLVFQGVLAVFRTLKDGQGELSGELGKEIKAAGLLGLVTTVSRIVYRVSEFFAGFGEGVGAVFSRLGDVFSQVAGIVKPIIDKIFGLSGSLGEAAGATDVSAWRAWGNVIGKIVTVVGGFLAALAVVIPIIAKVAAVFAIVKPVILAVGSALLIVKSVIMFVGAALLVVAGGFVSVLAVVKPIILIIGAALAGVLWPILLIGGAVALLALAWKKDFMGIATMVKGLGGKLKQVFQSVVTAISNFSLADAGAALIDTFINGIQAAAGRLVETISGVLSRVREFLPFSDAKAGPLSNLTASGMAFIGTFAEGIMARASALVDTVSGVLGRIREYLPFSDAKTGPLSQLTASGMAVPGTLAQGVSAGAPALVSATDKMMGGLNLAVPPMGFDGLAPDLYSGFSVPAALPFNYMPAPATVRGFDIPAPRFDFVDEAPEPPAFGARGRSRAGGAKTNNFHIGNITLPNVSDPNGFIAALEAIADQRN